VHDPVAGFVVGAFDDEAVAAGMLLDFLQQQPFRVELPL